MEVADQVPELLERWEAWATTAKVAAARIPEWDEAGNMLRHAKSLPKYEAHKAALDAIAAQRSLLADPNPLPPILAALRADLRAAIEVATDQALAAHKDAVDKVKATPQWTQLPDSESDQFLNVVGLSAPPSLDIADDTRLLEALERSNLSARGDQAAAFAGKAGPAVDRLIQRVTPEAKVIRPESGLIATEQEADIYLSDLRKKILEALADGHPVSIN